MKISCGILPYRVINDELQVFLVHPGGPFFAKKDAGYWGISKGEVGENENYIESALREFKEETGVDLSSRKSDLVDIGQIVQANNKTVYAWAIEDNLDSLLQTNGFIDLSSISNKVTVTLGGKAFEVPEIDKGEFMNIEKAMEKINAKQSAFLKKLQDLQF